MIKSMIQSQPTLRKKGGKNGGLRITGLQKWFLGLVVVLLICVIRMITLMPVNDQYIDPSRTMKKADIAKMSKVHNDMKKRMEEVLSHQKKTHDSLLMGGAPSKEAKQNHQHIKKKLEETQEKMKERMRRAGITPKVKPGSQGDEPNMEETPSEGAEQRPQIRGAQPLAD